MTYFTWASILSKLETDLILEDEQWITESELLSYTNDAIRDTEALVHTLYEDYFLDYQSVTFSAGQELVTLPTNIYAFKVRRFLFEKETQRYPIQRLKDWKKFEEKSVTDYSDTSCRYEYFLINRSSSGDAAMLLSPPIRTEDAGQYGKLYFIRGAKQLATASDTCDIPEFINRVYAHVKYNVYAKEGHPLALKAKDDLDRETELMVGTLAAMVPDADNEIEPDFEYYEEMN